jgi:hypothetical protein
VKIVVLNTIEGKGSGSKKKVKSLVTIEESLDFLLEKFG